MTLKNWHWNRPRTRRGRWWNRRNQTTAPRKASARTAAPPSASPTRRNRNCSASGRDSRGSWCWTRPRPDYCYHLCRCWRLGRICWAARGRLDGDVGRDRGPRCARLFGRLGRGDHRFGGFCRGGGRSVGGFRSHGIVFGSRRFARLGGGGWNWRQRWHLRYSVILPH